MLPPFAGRIALIKPAVISYQQALAHRRLRRLVLVFWFGRLRCGRAAGLNGERMHIRMQLLRQVLTKTVASVVRNEQREAEHVNSLVVNGVDSNLAEIK